MRVFSILYQNEFSHDLCKSLVGKSLEDEARDGNEVYSTSYGENNREITCLTLPSFITNSSCGAILKHHHWRVRPPYCHLAKKSGRTHPSREVAIE